MEILISILAGLLAGFGTGFAGLSAAVFIAPMLVAFLGTDSFSAIGIALASDVLASFVSGVTYYRHGNTSIKRSAPLMITVLVFAVVGTVISHILTGISVGENLMGWWLVVASLLLGIKLLFFPGGDKKKEKNSLPVSDRALMIICGIYIGFVCGFQGTGGGLMLLFVLNILMGLEFKKSVGTSVSIMAVTALIGAIGHFTLRGLPDLKLMVMCMLFTLIGAQAAALIANRISPVILKRLTGALMTVSCIAMVIAKL